METCVPVAWTKIRGASVDVVAEWREKAVATRQPEPMRWTEYSVEWKLRSPSPLHVAVFLGSGGELRFARLPAGVETDALAIRLAFSRHREAESWPAWPDEKLVHVSLGLSGGGAGVSVDALASSEPLWVDPRPETLVYVPERLTTGCVAPLAMTFHPSIKASAAVLGAEHVRITHGRWKADLKALDRLPPGFEPLADGRRSGTIGSPEDPS